MSLSNKLKNNLIECVNHILDNFGKSYLISVKMLSFAFQLEVFFRSVLLLSIGSMFSQERLQPEQSARRKRLLTDILKANYVKKGWTFKMVLIKSSIILILTVASISSDNLSKRVRHFETLHSSHLSHTIVKRGLDPDGTHKFNKIREVGFRTLGRDFRLILSPKKGLLHPNFKV